MKCSVATTDPKAYKLIANVYWPTKKQLTEAQTAFEDYIRKELKAGKTVILGDHRGCLQADKIKLYNELVNEFPGKVHFLWA
jgi:hypothetical protein